jgi:hypothetical protein
MIPFLCGGISMSGPMTTVVQDLRDTQRYPCEVQTTCQPPSGWRKDPWPAVIRNVSTGGISLRLGRRFEPGTGLAIDLPTEDGSTSTVLARVCHLEPGEGGWLLGCTFISELSDDEVRAILNLDPVHQASLESPDTPRGPASPSITGVLFQTRVHGEVLRWYVKRLDLSGSWPLPDGKAVSFRLAGHAVDLLIKKCRLIGSYWIVDCKFRNDPTEAALEALTRPAS